MSSAPARRAAHRSSRRDFDHRDPLGRMALFSDVEPETASEGPLFVACSSCLKETAVSPLAAARATLPLSVHVPFLKRYPSFMRCPACRKRTWVRLLVRR